MNDIVLTSIILTVALIKTILDITHDFKTCFQSTPSIFFTLYFHAVIWVYTYLGWLYKGRAKTAFYLIVVICMVLHWMLNDGRCAITVHANKVCGFGENKMYENPTSDFLSSIILLILRSVAVIGAIYKLHLLRC